MTGYVAAAILAPIALGLILLIARRMPGGLRNTLSLLGTLSVLALVVALWTRAGTGSHSLWYFSVLRVQTSPMFLVDGVGLLFAVLFSFIWLLVTIYSFGRMKDNEHQHEYFSFLLIMLGAVVGLCVSQNLLMIYLFWEVAGISTWRLVAFFRGERDIQAAQKTLLVTFAGSVMMLVGFAMVYVEQYTFTVTYMPGGTWSLFSALLVLAGMLTKSACLPFYFWLPDAYAAAPSPANALSSGAVANIGLIAYLRVFVQGQMVLPQWWPYLVAGLGVGAALVGAGVALREKDYKRILAYSSVSQLGYVFIGLAFASVLGITAAVVYIVAHSLAKAGLFIAMDAVERQTGRRSIDELGGLARTMPVTAFGVALLMLSMVGLPPLLGFFGKFYVVLAALRYSPVIAVTALVAAVMTALYMLRLYRVFVGEAREGVSGRDYAGAAVVVSILALASVALGLLFPLLSRLLETGVVAGVI